MYKNVFSYTLAGLLIGVILTTLLFLIIMSAGGRPESAGFRLPPGNSERGIEAFQELNCTTCHLVKGHKGLASQPDSAEMSVVLGGESPRLKTYGELVTAVIHPSEQIRREEGRNYRDEDGKSLMPELGDKMTVQQMIDIVTFLQGQYTVEIPNEPVPNEPAPNVPAPNQPVP